MIEMRIPGHSLMDLQYLVLDFNGTIAADGEIIPGVKERLGTLSPSLEIHILTADTFDTVRKELTGVSCRLAVITEDGQPEAKLRYVEQLGSQKCVCVGNGRNDRLMLEAAALGIAVVQAEGAAVEAVLGADVVTCSILDALDLLLCPRRLAATLRA